MEKTFRAVDEPRPGAHSRRWIERSLPVWRAWYDGAAEKGWQVPDAATCRRRLADAMPEVLKGYDEACALYPDDPFVHVALSEVDVPPMIPSGCTIRAVAGERPGEGPSLVRNYDFSADHTSGVVMRTKWREERVLGMAEGVIGLLDGVNDSGLAAALTFGGRPAAGPGFGILLILRWVLEACRTVREATEALGSARCGWAQNLLLLDAAGETAVVKLSPDRDTEIGHGVAITNHQAPSEGSDNSHARLAAAGGLSGGVEDAVAAFHRPPILGRESDWLITLYTAVYRPADGEMDLRWPGAASWPLAIDPFEPGERTVPIARQDI